MKTRQNNLLSLAEAGAGARALARFNARNNESLEIAHGFSLHALKRRERRAPRRSEDGSATIVFIALLAIMVILVTVNGKALFGLHREVKFLEQQQIKRLNASQTNAVAVIQPDSK